MPAKRFEVGKRALLKRKETIMNDLRVLTDAELDFVGGGTGMVGGCGTTTATFAPVSRPTSGGCGIEELIADIFKILEGNNCSVGLKRVAA
jgi:hypothetical protein